MADSALWATACESALWEEGTFWRAYAGNRDEAVDSVIEADPVGSAVRSLMATRTEWTGTASDLLGALSAEVGETVRRAKTWPATARALSGRLRRAATFLRKVGTDISFDREGRARTRIIWISREPEDAVIRSSAPSAPSVDQGKCIRDNDSGATSLRTVTRSTDANGQLANHTTVRDNASESKTVDGADGTDANIPSQSGAWRKRV